MGRGSGSVGLVSFVPALRLLRSGIFEHGQQVASGSGHSGADRPGRAVANLARLLVGEPNDLGEREGGAPVGLKAVQQVGDNAVLADVGPVWHGRCGPNKAVVAPGAAGSGTDLVDARIAGDGEQPGPGRGVTAVVVEGTDGAKDGFLGEIVGAISIGEGGA